MEYQQVQRIAKDTMDYAKTIIRPGMHLMDIRRLCEEKMRELGADSFWYWDVGAFVFSGDETAVSVSGRVYATSERTIEPDDIITIDLSPQCGDTWGDYARTIVLQDGRVAENDAVLNEEWRNGLMMEELLHRELAAFASPSTTFEELYEHINGIIAEKGFVNLDFSGNLGHSIVRQKDQRIYIERGNTATLGEAAYFTFEPHISVRNSKYGYKMENIYYFDKGVLNEL